jgi:hypothetical protein
VLVEARQRTNRWQILASRVRRSPIRRSSIALAKSPVGLTREDVSPRVFTRKPRLQPAEFLISGVNGLLQQYRSKTTKLKQSAARPSYLQRRKSKRTCIAVGKENLHVTGLWAVQPCVRPLNAVHMTAGHNALRGSGPGQFPAFENAVAHVGCPDRRIDRLCITCCSPSQPSHHATVRGRDLIRLSARLDNCIARP